MDIYNSILNSIKDEIEKRINEYNSESKLKNTRLYEYIVTSEDLKIDSGADYILCERQIGLGAMLVRDGDFIGYIDDYTNCLGGDIVINEIKIYKDDNLSKQLTDKYKNKILICSWAKDRFNS